MPFKPSLCRETVEKSFLLSFLTLLISVKSIAVEETKTILQNIYWDFTNAQPFFVSACEQATSEEIKLVN